MLASRREGTCEVAPAIQGVNPATSKRYKPKLDPKVDLTGATPETLARALFRRVDPLPLGPRGQPVVDDEPPVGKRVSGKSDGPRPTLVKRF